MENTKKITWSNTGAFFLPNGIIAYAENLFKIPFGRKEML